MILGYNVLVISLDWIDQFSFEGCLRRCEDYIHLRFFSMEIVNVTMGSSNITVNTTNSDQEFRVVLGGICIAIFVGIVVFNMTVIGLIACKRNKTRLAFFVGNLAVADLFLGIFYVLPEAIFNYFLVPWNKHYCYILYIYFSMVPFYTSTYAIVALTIDRLYAIVKPMSAASRGLQYKIGLCLVTWLVGLLLSIQYGIIGYFSKEKQLCFFPFPDLYSKVILYLDVMVLMVIPLVVIIVSYAIIIRAIYRREKRGFVPAATDDSQVNTPAKDRNISHAKIKTIKLLFVVVFAYTICWLPYFTGAVLQHHGRIGKSSRTFLILYTLAPTNSLANPLVFLIFNFKMFRKKSTRKKNNTFQMSSKAERSTFLTNHIDHNRSCAIHSHEYA